MTGNTPPTADKENLGGEIPFFKPTDLDAGYNVRESRQYEREEWRATQFATHILEWLPEFALKHSELTDLHSGNAVQLIRDAARRVYESKKFENRGEFGELFLHAAIRQVFNSLPAISKIYYKSARNDTAKGFDAVHVVVSSSPPSKKT